MNNRKPVLLIGIGPLATEPDQNFIAAPGIRSWQFLQSALEKNPVILVTKELGPDKKTGFKKVENTSRFVHYSTRENMKEIGQYIKKLCQKNDFAAVTIIGSTSLAEVLPFLPSSIPLWFDLYGSVIAEGQVKAAAEKNNDFLDYYLNLEYQALTSGDMFSTVSTPQKHATIGELALTGRLNSFTNEYPFCHIIPATYFPQPATSQGNVLRGIKVKENDFVVLWSGGFNNWVDEKTLFEGLTRAMQANPSLHFVATGGQIKGVAHTIFNRFYDRVQSSPYRKQFHFEGWVNGSLIPSYYREADIAVNVDLPAWETRLGARNRLLGWIYFDLPIITTSICEFAGNLEKHRACYTFDAGDASSLAQTLLTCQKLPRRCLQATAQRAKALFLERYCVESIMKPYRKWLDNPGKAPDYEFYSHHAYRFPNFSPFRRKEQRNHPPVSSFKARLKQLWKKWKK